jgi:hypothetical protein
MPEYRGWTVVVWQAQTQQNDGSVPLQLCGTGVSDQCFKSNFFYSDARPSSHGSSENSRPTSRLSQVRPNSRHADQGLLRSYQSYGQDLNGQQRPRSASDQRSTLHAARSMTSMSQYRGNSPHCSGRSPSPAFYGQDHYGGYREPEDELDYPVDDIEYGYDMYDCRRTPDIVSPLPRSPADLPPTMRQTPSPLRWAMQDLMDSLDTMSPRLSSAPSPPRSRSRTDLHFDDGRPHSRAGSYVENTWGSDEGYEPQVPTEFEIAASEDPYMYPADMRPPPLLNYVDKMQSRIHRFQNYHYSPQHNENDPLVNYHDHQRSPSRASNVRPRSSHSVDKALPASPSFHPPMPPPHKQKSRWIDTESESNHSAKHSVFSTSASDYSTATSSVSTGSAGSAGAFARKKARQQKEQDIAKQRSALSVLPKNSGNGSLMKRRKSYGSSFKKTIGKLLNTSPTKPPPGTVTDHGGKIIEWQNVRRDVNRANSPSPQERTEHRERLEMSEGIQVISPIELLERIVEGDESANGSPILPDETFDISRKA